MKVPPRQHPTLLTILMLLTVVLLPDSARAHGGIVPLKDWGNFSPSAAYCQRIIGAATAGCALQAAHARHQCLDAQSRGVECDEVATTAAIAAIRRDALDLIDLYCSERDAQTVGYLGSFDLQADVIRFCREWETTTASAVYGTLQPGAVLDDATYACVKATAVASAKLAQLTFDTWRSTLDRIATRSSDLAGKESMIDRGGARVAGLPPRAAHRLADQCAAAGFESIYHRTAGELTALLTTRAGCLAPAFYLQDKLVCPPSVCGNWITEPGETCDDGNTVDGDGCDSECLGTVPGSP